MPTKRQRRPDLFRRYLPVDNKVPSPRPVIAIEDGIPTAVEDDHTAVGIPRFADDHVSEVIILVRA